jgi:hypothetical protein
MLQAGHPLNRACVRAGAVFLATRSGAWIIPKYIGGKPMDAALVPGRVFFMLLPRWLREHPAILGPLLEGRIRAIQGDPQRFGLKPKARLWQAHPTVSQNLLNRIGNGTVTPKPNAERFVGPDQVVRPQRADRGVQFAVDACWRCCGTKGL